MIYPPGKFMPASYVRLRFNYTKLSIPGLPRTKEAPKNDELLIGAPYEMF